MAVVLLVCVATDLQAQFRRGFGNIRRATEEDYDGAFHFCRAIYRSDFRGDGGNWSVDWPRADINLSMRLGELTRTSISKTGGEPNPLLLQLTDDALFQLSVRDDDRGGLGALRRQGGRAAARVRPEGRVRLGRRLLGQLRVGVVGDARSGRCCRPQKFPIIELPLDHPLFHTQFVDQGTPQIASIGFWAGTGGGTSERGADSAIVHSKAILDAHGRIMVLMTHNTDIGDSFEREGDDPRYFMTMSVPGYAYGVNALLYTLTH